MRVMHFVPYFPPDRVGGVGSFAASLHAGLRRRGVDSTVVTAGHSRAEGVERIARSRLGWFLGTLRFARRAAACDVVHCQSGEALPVVLALRLLPRRRARIVATFHSSTLCNQAAERSYQLEGRRFRVPLRSRLPGALMARLHHWLDALTLRLADGATSVCRASARDCFGPRRAAAVRVIYPAVDEAGESSGGADPEPVELLYVGVARPRKRVHALPFVLRHVRHACPGSRLRIAGFELDDVPGLRELFAELGLADAVECVRRSTPGELAGDYRAARVLVLPSAYEGLPTVILEAMQQQTPVVATRVSGHPEVIDDGVNGFLVELDRPELLAARCVEILRNPELAARLGAAARQTVAQRFGLAREIDEYLDYYRALSEARG